MVIVLPPSEENESASYRASLRYRAGRKRDSSSTETLFDTVIPDGTTSANPYIISIWEGSQIEITHLGNATPSGILASYGYWIYAPGGSTAKEDVEQYLTSYGLQLVEEGGLSVDFDITGSLTISTPGAIYPVDIPFVIRRLNTSGNPTYKYFTLRVYQLPTTVTINVAYDMSNVTGNLYPIQLQAGEDFATIYHPDASGDSSSCTLPIDTIQTFSANVVDIDLVGDGTYSYDDGTVYTYPADTKPLMFHYWVFSRDGESNTYYYTDTISLPIGISIINGTLTAVFRPAIRLHLKVMPILIDGQSINLELAGGDAYIATYLTQTNIITTLPKRTTTTVGYDIQSWDYQDTHGNDRTADPGESVQLWLDSQTGRLNGSAAYNNMITLIGDANLAITDDAPFAIILDPAGGTFLPPALGGNVTVSATVDGVAVTSFIYYDPSKKVWAWWADDVRATDSKELVATFSNVPLTSSDGLTPPAGIMFATNWTISAPYYISPTNATTFSITLKRSSTDSICQKTMYPVWKPDQIADRQRAMLTAPGYGAIDLGNIQSITETYTSKVSQVPIVVYGYTGAFCMDLGVQKEISINYLRTNPKVIDNSSGDSRDWSNAKWIEMLKNVMNRWQMRTDGNRLYILRPKSIRGETIEDPMIEYVNEVNGANCYITSLPVKYDQNPHTIAGTIGVSMGTLYPQQTEMTPYVIIFKKDNNHTGTRVEHTGRFMNLPNAMNIWTGDEDGLTVSWDGSKWVFNGTVYHSWIYNGTEYNFGKVIDLSDFTDSQHPYGPITFVADSTSVSNGNGVVLMNNSTSTDLNANITITSTGGAIQAELYIGAVGGGGGGGAGQIVTQKSDKGNTSGGGGGASGKADWHYVNLPFSNSTISLSAKCGHGGEGGIIYSYVPGTGPAEDTPGNGDGKAGGESWIKYGDQNIAGGQGGGGGERGSHSWGQEKVAYGGGNPSNTLPGGKTAYKAGGDGGQQRLDATSGGSYSLESTVAGKGGIAGNETNRFTGGDRKYYAGGGGGGGGFYLSGMEADNVGRGGNGAEGYATYAHATDVPWMLPTQNAGAGAGGGGGGGAFTYYYATTTDYKDASYNGGNGGGGWIFICILSGGEITNVQ